RLALFQYMFIRAVSVPPFSRADDVAREDVLEMVFALRMDEALAQLRRAYPTSAPGMRDFTLAEEAEYLDGDDHGYEAIHRNFIEPIEHAYALTLRIGTALANHFGAHG